MKFKPIIGVCPLWDESKNSYWMLPGYMDGIIQAGGLPIMLPFEQDETAILTIMNICSGFLFTGGQDVSPELYGDRIRFENVECCRRLDDLEKTLLENALEKDKPILGICRGIQFINAALGGTLYQDIPSEMQTDINHHQAPPYDRPVHKVYIEKSSPLYALTNQTVMAVNSYHHQAVKELSPRLKIMARAEDGIVEGVYMPDKKFVWAVQWHPELSFQTNAQDKKIWQAFIESALPPSLQ